MFDSPYFVVGRLTDAGETHRHGEGVQTALRPDYDLATLSCRICFQSLHNSHASTIALPSALVDLQPLKMDQRQIVVLSGHRNVQDRNSQGYWSKNALFHAKEGGMSDGAIYTLNVEWKALDSRSSIGAAAEMVC